MTYSVDSRRLNALGNALDYERMRLFSARTKKQVSFQKNLIAELEFAVEKEFQSIKRKNPAPKCNLTDDELLAELLA